MSLHIIVCVKRTPASTTLALDESGAVKTAGLQHAINPFDEYAVEEALRLREKVPGSFVSVLTAGPAESEEVLRAALSLGVDEGILLRDSAFDGSDTIAVSHILAKAIVKLAAGGRGTQLALFGKQTNDGESGHVTAAVGAWLGWPSAISVRKIGAISASEATVERLCEEGADTLNLKLPAVIGVTKEINEPRLPSLKGKMAAKKATLTHWGASDLGADLAIIGDKSPTRVVKMTPVPSRKTGTLISGSSPEEQARSLVAKLREAKFI